MSDKKKITAFIVTAFLLVTCHSSLVIAQLWSGIIAPSRATDWSNAGTTIPAGWTQCGSTIAAYSGTAATINNAIAACGNNQYVLLGAGTFNLSTGVDFQGRSSVILRGSGANQSMLVFSGDATCSGLSAAFCVEGDNSLLGGSSGIDPDNTATWTATSYAAGQTQITLSILTGSLANLHVGNPIILDQCDSGLSGSTCATGTDTDTGQVWICETVAQGCSDDNTGPSGGQRTNRAEEQIVTVTAINGSTITFTPGLRMANWSASRSPQAFWSSSPNHDVGIEDLSSDYTVARPHADITIWNCYNCWVKGFRSIFTAHNVNNNEYNHIWLVLSPHVTIRDSYFFGSESLQSEGYGIEFYATGDDLAENNIFQQMPSPQMLDGACSGCVVGYNYSINDNNQSNFLFNSFTLHSPVDYTLAEGNVGNSYRSDLFHGSHNFNTAFRNYYNGWETAPINNGFTADYLDPASRYYNMIGNVFGEPSFFTCYQETPSISCAQWPVYTVGTGTTTVQTGGDALTVNSLMRWGNYDTFNSATHFLSSEVPSSFSDSTGNPSVFVNPVPGSQTLPASFYYSSKPSWWPSGKPWPAIGPDVTGGNVAGLGGHVYTIPAQDCYSNVMGGPPDGTGSALSFNAATCYQTQPPATGGGSVIACGNGASGAAPCVSAKIASTACEGGPPSYCSDSSIRLVTQSDPSYPSTDPNDGGPPAGVPFADPDFGNRIVRVTDSSTVNLYGTGVNSANSFFTDSSSEANAFSVFDPTIGVAGGYRFDFSDSAGHWLVDTLDATTMQTQFVETVSENGYWSFSDPYVFFVAGSGGTIKYYCMPGVPADDAYCHGSAGLVTLFTVNSTSCPNLPSSGTPAFIGSMSVSKDDQSFGDFWGGSPGSIVIYYNQGTGKCDWYDTINGTIGGSDYTGVQNATFGPIPAPVAAPTLAPITGTGSLPAGTYCVEETIITDYDLSGMETTPGPSSCVQLTATGEISVPIPALGTDSVTKTYFQNTGNVPYAWKVYACQESAPPSPCTSFALQNATTLGWSPTSCNGAPITATYLITTLAAGAAPPTVNQGGYAIHNTRISWSGDFDTTEAAGCVGSLLDFWQVGTLTNPAGADFGHYVAGYQSAARNWNNWIANFLSTNMTTIANTNMTTQPHGYFIPQNTHLAWADDNTTDTYPVEASVQAMNQTTSGTGWTWPIPATTVVPNGTRVPWPQTGYNPTLSKYAPYIGEVLGAAMDGSGTVWRFANERSNYYENWTSGSPQSQFEVYEVLGNESQDGKFFMFTSSWNWTLGTFGLGGWQANHAFTTGTKITDSNGNIETAGGNGTTASVAPTWSTTVGGTTSDGTETWTMSQSGGCPWSGQCRADVFIVQTR